MTDLNKWMTLRFGINKQQGSYIISLSVAIEIIFVPIMGYLGDKYI